MGGIIGLVQVPDDALGHPARSAVQGLDGAEMARLVVAVDVARRHVDAGDLRHSPEKAGLVPALGLGPAVEIENLRRHLLALADGEEVNEIGQRLGVHGADASGEDQALQPRPVLAAERHTGQIQHI